MNANEARKPVMNFLLWYVLDYFFLSEDFHEKDLVEIESFGQHPEPVLFFNKVAKFVVMQTLEHMEYQW